MTVSIQVSVNGNHKVPVTVNSGYGEPITEVISGRGHDGPKIKYISYPGRGVVKIAVGPEEPDNG